MRYFIICCSFLAADLISAQQLQGPETTPAGALLEIKWTTGNPKDFITIVPGDAPEGKYLKYKYASAGVWKVLAPEKPGDYEIRYLGAKSPYKTLSSKPLRVTPVTATLQSPGDVDAGAMLSIRWTGPGNDRDFITIVKKGTPERKYAKYVYTKKGNPASLKAPEDPGEYEIRYLTGVEYFTLASIPIRVGKVSASLDAPSAVDAGAMFEVSWTGPDNKQDFITIVEASAEPKAYGKYVYTSKGSPISLPAPDKPGDYEVRYLTGEKRYILAASAIRVGAVSASIAAPESVSAGSAISIEWTGPANRQDFITLVKKDAREGSYDKYVYVRSGSPLTLMAPDAPGQYEIRYATGAKYYTLASHAITVQDVSAELEAPGKAVGGGSVSVKWTGPGNPRDFVAFAPKGSALRDWKTYAYTQRGNPLVIRTPMEPGLYELRYHMGQDYRILATRTIEVEAPQVGPGQVVVKQAAGESALWSDGAVELILDASGSMLQRIDGKRRIEVAREVLTDLVKTRLEEGTPFAFRVFGHKEADSCRTDLVQPLGPLNKAQALDHLSKINAMNLAKTPIARSLELVASDLSGVAGKRTVVLITDGEETCGGDPAGVIEALKEGGIDIRVNIVGFAIDDSDLKQTFRLWADLGDGGYFDASDAQQLRQAMDEAFQAPYDLINESGDIIASGLVGGEPIQAAPGMYHIKTRETKPRELKGIEISPGKLKEVTLTQK